MSRYSNDIFATRFHGVGSNFAEKKPLSRGQGEKEERNCVRKKKREPNKKKIMKHESKVGWQK